jgi:hypothetical protein
MALRTDGVRPSVRRNGGVSNDGQLVSPLIPGCPTHLTIEVTARLCTSQVRAFPARRLPISPWSDLLDARRQLDLAWERAGTTEEQLLSDELPASDGQLAYTLALRDTEAAISHYSHALDVFKAAVLFDLKVDEESSTEEI